MIPPVVLDELDAKKSTNSKIALRARKVLNRIESIESSSSSEFKANTHLKIIHNKPKQETYDSYQLEQREQDQRLLASIIEFKNSEAIDSDVLICSEDVGVRLRAKKFGITWIQLDDSCKLKEEESDEQKELKKLKLENEQLKNRVPKLKLEFKKNSEFINIKRPNIPSSSNDFITEEIEKIKIANPLISAIDPYQNPLSILTSPFSLTQEQIKNYNNKLEKFYDRYKSWLIENKEFEMKSKLTFEIEIDLANNGTVPAEDIDVHMHFPDGFELVNSKEIEEGPIKPTPPYKPKNQFDFGPIQGIPRISPTSFDFDQDFDPNRPEIKKSNSYDVNYHFKKLKHQYSHSLSSLSLIFNNISEVKNFSIEYTVSAGNLPIPVEGKLGVVFE
jgi:hypothetical protein